MSSAAAVRRGPLRCVCAAQLRCGLSLAPAAGAGWRSCGLRADRFWPHSTPVLLVVPSLGRGSGTFRSSELGQDGREALEHGLADGIAHLDDVADHTDSSTGIFGTRKEMAGAYDNRNVGAKKGLYGLPLAIAWYGGWLVDSNGDRISGSTDYTITFTAEQLPKARFFWSATLYTLPQRLLSANEIDRYAIGDRTEGIGYGDDGSLTLYVQHSRPDAEAEAANWLPAPDGPFTVIIRAYGGDTAIAGGTYRLPPISPR